MNVSGKRAKIVLCLMLLVTSTATALFQFDSTFAAQINTRKLTLGSSGPSLPTPTVTTYTFNFTVPTTGTAIKSAQFQVCTTPTQTCTTPAGFVNSSTLVAQPTNLGAATGWTGNAATAGSLRVVNSGNSTNPTGSQTVAFSGVTNPNAANTTFYVRMTTYSDAAWTTAIDSGVVAASTAQIIQVTGTMPEYLQFCTGGAITVTTNVPDCSSATSGNITFNQEFNATATATATSMMAAATNGTSGYVITTTGTTLTSGSNTIAAAGATAVAANTTRGTSVFGINLVANTTTTSTPAVGAAINPVSNASDLRGLASTGFATADSFALDLTGATAVAKSDNTTVGSPAPTKSQAYTVSYIANVSAIQPAGTYVSTINYICTPTF